MIASNISVLRKSIYKISSTFIVAFDNGCSISDPYRTLRTSKYIHAFKAITQDKTNDNTTHVLVTKAIVLNKYCFPM